MYGICISIIPFAAQVSGLYGPELEVLEQGGELWVLRRRRFHQQACRDEKVAGLYGEGGIGPAAHVLRRKRDEKCSRLPEVTTGLIAVGVGDGRSIGARGRRLSGCDSVRRTAVRLSGLSKRDIASDPGADHERGRGREPGRS